RPAARAAAGSGWRRARHAAKRAAASCRIGLAEPCPRQPNADRLHAYQHNPVQPARPVDNTVVGASVGAVWRGRQPRRLTGRGACMLSWRARRNWADWSRW
ncbi:MAG: hypothetical protein WBH47_24130, partial [Streptosporangiaceae bacterium]